MQRIKIYIASPKINFFFWRLVRLGQRRFGNIAILVWCSGTQEIILFEIGRFLIGDILFHSWTWLKNFHASFSYSYVQWLNPGVFEVWRGSVTPQLQVPKPNLLYSCKQCQPIPYYISSREKKVSRGVYPYRKKGIIGK